MPFILFNKPYGIVSQFSGDKNTLTSFIDDKSVYPAGRLDKKSEGLLILTNDGRLQARICEPQKKLLKYYFAQVEGAPNTEQINTLKNGLMLKDGPAQAQIASLSDCPEKLWERIPPIRHREKIPTAWVKIAINEGRKHQIRRMLAAVNLPVLRLIRWQVGPWEINDLKLGDAIVMTNKIAWSMVNHY
tara:strand:+ start:649 stop:1212 length:564 start_codon:yes stop_codon:yes gene_type:complete